VVWSAAILSVYAAVFERWAVVDLGDGTTAWIVAMLGVDFLYYWWHRLSHE